ncbi:MAG: DUF302 domain-containing protein [Candidatus Thiodiazotropha sp. 6PLUC10]
MPDIPLSVEMRQLLTGGTMYEFNTEIDLSFDKAVARVRDVLMEEHLGVVSDVDVQAIFKNKMDKDIPAYHIFGACNPGLADRVLSSEPNAGTLLPCNFIMREQENGKVVVSFMDPETVLGHCTTEEPKKVATEAKQKLLRVIEKLNAN